MASGERWRDSMAGSPRQADYAWTVLVRILSWARERTLTTYRPPERVERLYHSDRSDLIWEDHHIAAINAVASESLRRALTLAAETGLRQGDIVSLPWSAYDDRPPPDSALGWIRTTPSKGITLGPARRERPSPFPSRGRPPRLAGGIISSTNAHSAFVRSLGYRKPCRSAARRRALGRSPHRAAPAPPAHRVVAPQEGRGWRDPSRPRVGRGDGDPPETPWRDMSGTAQERGRLVTTFGSKRSEISYLEAAISHVI